MTELRYFKKAKADEALSAQVLQIRTDDIRPNRAQPRAEFEQNSIIRLADSIRRYGILQPLTVRASDAEDIYAYELIAGERRLRAAKMLGYLTVPCVVMEVDDRVSAELAMIENLLREDLNMFEQAYGFKKLIENYHLTQEEVARRMSMSQSAVANKIRLLKLSYEEQRMILESGLSERHARASLRLTDGKLRTSALHAIVERKMTVQEAEEYIESLIRREAETSREGSYVSSTCAEELFREERDMMDMVKTLRRRVDEWTKNGKTVSMSVENQSETVEIRIRLKK